MSAPLGLAHMAKAVPLLALPILVAIAPLPSRRDPNHSGAAYAAPARGGKSKQAPKDFTYTVSDCHEAGVPDSIRLEVSEGAVAWSQILNMNCIAATRPSTVKLSYAKKGRNLEVSIILRSNVFSDCTCPIGIEGRIAGLGRGDHRISFIYDHNPGDSANEQPIRQTLATQGFSLK